MILPIAAPPGLTTRTREYWPPDTAGFKKNVFFQNDNPEISNFVFLSEEERSSGSDSGIFQGKISPHRLVGWLVRWVTHIGCLVCWLGHTVGCLVCWLVHTGWLIGPHSLCHRLIVWAVIHYMSSWDRVGMYFKMVGMDPNRCAALCLHLPTTTISIFSTHHTFCTKK